MKKFLLIFLSSTIILLIGICLFIFYKDISKIEIENIIINENINDDNTKTLTVKIINKLNKNIYCAINTENKVNDTLTWTPSDNNKCTFNVNAGSYYIYIKDDKNNIKEIKSNEINIDKILDLKLNKEKIYLNLEETFEIKPEIISLGNTDNTLTYHSSDENIAVINEQTIIPKNPGKAIITVTTTNGISKEINVTTSNLYKKASLDNNKEFLTCRRYTEEENKILDEVLEYKINEAGYQTRGAVIASLRFLILEFPYRIPYFFENGRLNNYEGIDYVDGEGRYYKKGLYLNESKFNDIKATFSGPAIWGCPLMNWHEEYTYHYGVKYPNGLDCSGFVSWALLNAGFDVGDSGSGNTERDDDIGDLGEHHPLTREFVLEGNYKPGDLIGWDGHIGLIAGIDDNNIYVAESLIGGLVIKEFSKTGSKLYELYEFINTMDNVYKSEGNYTYMW